MMKILPPIKVKGLVPAVAFLLLVASLIETHAFQFRPAPRVAQPRRLMVEGGMFSTSTTTNTTSTTAEKVAAIRQELLDLGAQTDRGFRADTEDRKRARELIFDLASYNAVREPARAYYYYYGTSPLFESQDNSSATVTGQWTLVYTDAPDITSLDKNSLAELGRIGQECNPPYITNVIEWKRPSWAANFPFAGTESSRVIQKVVTKATAEPSSPSVVDLAIAGFQLETDSYPGGNNVPDAIQREGLIAGLLQNRAVDISVWNAPFGSFEILYIDDDFRITKTGQNYFAVNTRVKSGEEWF